MCMKACPDGINLREQPTLNVGGIMPWDEARQNKREKGDS